MFGTALGGRADDSAVIFWGDYYINRRFRFALSSPPGWHFSHVKDMGTCKTGMILMDDPEFTTGMLGSFDDPIVTVSKESITDTPPFKFTPGCTVFIERYDEELDGIHKDIIWQEIEGSYMLFKDFSLGADAQHVGKLTRREP